MVCLAPFSFSGLTHKVRHIVPALYHNCDHESWRSRNDIMYLTTTVRRKQAAVGTWKDSLTDMLLHSSQLSDPRRNGHPISAQIPAPACSCHVCRGLSRHLVTYISRRPLYSQLQHGAPRGLVNGYSGIYIFWCVFFDCYVAGRGWFNLTKRSLLQRTVVWSIGDHRSRVRGVCASVSVVVPSASVFANNFWFWWQTATFQKRLCLPSWNVLPSVMLMRKQPL